MTHDPTQLDSLLKSALEYAKRGWKIFPVLPKAKEPRTAHGFLDATSDPKTIERWWRMWPDSNIGLATGKANGLVVLDIDPRNGGDETLKQILSEHGPFDETVEAITGGGGRHIFFKYPTNHNISGCKLAPGVDVKADGGYIVVAPSIHPSGRVYAWELSHHPDSLSVADLPKWLHALKSKEQKPQSSIEAATIPEGQRNETLASLAGSMRRRGMGEPEILAALRETNRLRCSPALDDKEVQKIARSISRYAPAEPEKSNGSAAKIDTEVRQWTAAPESNNDRSKHDYIEHAVPRFPIEALPTVVRKFVEEQAASISCPIDFLAASAIAGLSTAIGSTRTVGLKSGWTEGTSVWCCIVGESGTRKSAALKPPLERLYARHAELFAKWKLEEHTRSLVRKAGSKEEWKQPETVITSDVTVEGLCSVLESSPRGVLMVRDELGGWVKAMNQYKEGGKGAEREFFLSVWSGAPVAMQRATKKPRFVPKPFMSIVGCIPPSMLKQLTTDADIEDGLVQRLLFFYPTRAHDVKFDTTSPNPFTQRAFDALIESLLSATDHRRLALAPKAERAFAKIHDELYDRRTFTQLPEPLHGHWSKFSGYLARLALTMELSTDPKSELISLETVERSASMIEYFKATAKLAHSKLEESLTTDKSQERKCEKTIIRLLTQRPMTRREIQQRSHTNAVVFARVWKCLVQDGLVIEQKDGIKLCNLVPKSGSGYDLAT